MKTNAIIRIILFSLAIVILSGILVCALFLNHFSFSGSPSISIDSDTIEVDSLKNIELGSIRELEIEWVDGSITIMPDNNISEFSIHETGAGRADYQTIYTVTDDTLHIAFCKDTLTFPVIGVNVDYSKDLVIYVPAEWYCEELTIEAASADVNISDLIIGKLEFDGASGEFVFENCTVKQIEIDTASGDVSFNGQLDYLKFNAASAAFHGTIHNVPRRLEMDSMSGNLNIRLPEDCGFTMAHQSMSGHYTCEFETTETNGMVVHGDGRCEINVNTMSGNVTIKKHVSDHSPATECTDPNCTDHTHNHHSTIETGKNCDH